MSTTPNNSSDGTSDSGGPIKGFLSDSKKKATTKKMVHASVPADSSTTTTGSSSGSTGSSSSSSSSSNISTASAARDRWIACLEDQINVKDLAVVKTTNQIIELVDKRRELLKVPESRRNVPLLIAIGENLAYTREWRKRWTGDIEELKLELKELKYPKEPIATTIPL